MNTDKVSVDGRDAKAVAAVKAKLTGSGDAPSEAELNKIIDAANTLIDFVIDRNYKRQDVLDRLNEIRTAALNDLDDLTGASY